MFKLYIPQGHYFIGTLWLWSTDEYVKKIILSESPPLIYIFIEIAVSNTISKKGIYYVPVTLDLHK